MHMTLQLTQKNACMFFAGLLNWIKFERRLISYSVHWTELNKVKILNVRKLRLENVKIISEKETWETDKHFQELKYKIATPPKCY